jgi:hypothetical protein
VTKKKTTKLPAKFPIEYVPHETGAETIDLWGMSQLVRKAIATLSVSGDNKRWAHVLAQHDDHTLAIALIRDVTGNGIYGATLAYTRFRGDDQLLEAAKALLAEAKRWAKEHGLE